VTSTIQASLTITPPAVGTVTGQGISCPGDCTEDLDYEETCWIGPGPDFCESDPAEVALTATRGGAGWAPTWSGCSPSTDNPCTVTVTGHKTVSVAWRDVAGPTVTITGQPTRVGRNTTFTVGAFDNQSVTEVDFYVDGTQVFSDSVPPFQFNPAETGVTHGASRTLKAIAFDIAGNTSQPLASAPSHTYTYDLESALTGFGTSPLLTLCTNLDACPRVVVPAPPAFTFTTPADSTVLCFTDRAPGFSGDHEVFASPCVSGHSPTIPADAQPSNDGPWRTIVHVSDDLSNSTTYVHEWILDRRAPTIGWGAGAPANGATVKSPFTPGINPNDANFPDDQIQVSCDIGSGWDACGTFDPPDGPVTLKVRVVDGVGNERIEQRTFTYDDTAPAAAITSGPAEGALIRTRSVSFGFSASDVHAITTSCKVDQGEFGSCTGADSHAIDNLNPGIHTFTLRVVDVAGHETLIARQFVTDDPLPANDTPGTGGGQQPTPTTPSGPGGGSTPSDTSPSGTGAPAPIPPRPLVVAARTKPKWIVRGGKTKVKKLTLTGLARGAAIEVTCKGRGCFRGTSKFTAARATLDLTSLFKKRTLRTNAVIEVRISEPGKTARVFRYTMQKGKRKPKVETLCLPAGASKPGRC
jgi:hypothetical protein